MKLCKVIISFFARFHGELVILAFLYSTVT